MSCQCLRIAAEARRTTRNQTLMRFKIGHGLCIVKTPNSRIVNPPGTLFIWLTTSCQIILLFDSRIIGMNIEPNSALSSQSQPEIQIANSHVCACAERYHVVKLKELCISKFGQGKISIWQDALVDITCLISNSTLASEKGLRSELVDALIQGDFIDDAVVQDFLQVIKEHLEIGLLYSKTRAQQRLQEKLLCHARESTPIAEERESSGIRLRRLIMTVQAGIYWSKVKAHEQSIPRIC